MPDESPVGITRTDRSSEDDLPVSAGDGCIDRVGDDREGTTGSSRARSRVRNRSKGLRAATEAAEVGTVEPRLDAHDREIHIGEREAGGTRFEITGVERPLRERP